MSEEPRDQIQGGATARAGVELLAAATCYARTYAAIAHDAVVAAVGVHDALRVVRFRSSVLR